MRIRQDAYRIIYIIIPKGNDALITLARDGMRPDIERIWRLCFPDDAAEAVGYFFEHRYNPNACIVYIDSVSGRSVAMLHVLDMLITDDSEIKQGQYLYAAATRPDFQGKGIMTRLISAAQQFAEARGKTYTAVVPGEHSLIKFYEKRGFYRCFRNRVITFSRSDLVTLAQYKGNERKTKTVILGDSELAAVRRDSLIDREGYVTWGERAVSYAMGAHEAIGGRVIAVRKGYSVAYAFCAENNDIVDISELMASNELTVPLLRAVLDAYDRCDSFALKVPVSNEFFAPYGDISDFGMIKTTSGRKPANLLTLTGKHAPYMGLALD